MCLLGIYIFSFVKCLYKYFVHLKSLVVWRLGFNPWSGKKRSCFVLLSYKSSLYILATNPFSDMCILPVYDLPFLFFSSELV